MTFGHPWLKVKRRNLLHHAKRRVGLDDAMAIHNTRTNFLPHMNIIYDDLEES